MEKFCTGDKSRLQGLLSTEELCELLIEDLEDEPEEFSSKSNFLFFNVFSFFWIMDGNLDDDDTMDDKEVIEGLDGNIEGLEDEELGIGDNGGKFSIFLSFFKSFFK